jgi:hypothetical protein
MPTSEVCVRRLDCCFEVEQQLSTNMQRVCTLFGNLSRKAEERGGVMKEVPSRVLANSGRGIPS